MSGENSYVFTIVADGADADEIKAKLNDIAVRTAINHYDVAIGKAAGADISSEGFKGIEYNGSGTFIVTLKDGYTQTEPTINFEGDVAVTLDKAEGNVYTYKVTGIKSDAKITVTTKINEYKVVMVNYDGEPVFEGVLEHGQTPTYTNPGRPDDPFGGYTFAGWDTDGDGDVDVTAIANVTGDINATAVYTCNHVHAEDPTAEGTAWVLDSIEQADCEHDGVRHYKCSYSGCTETLDWTIPARGHKWTAEGEGWIIVKAPTCTETGLESRYCCNEETVEYKACNHKEENVILATGHHDSDEDYICDDCGVDLGHCSKCICHKGNVLSKVQRYICTLLTKIFHKPIKCCNDMEWYGDEPSSIS